MRPTRRTQPYRKSAAGRQAGPSLHAMLKGRTATGGNPADVQRSLAKKKRRRRKKPLRRGLAAKLSALPRTLPR